MNLRWALPVLTGAFFCQPFVVDLGVAQDERTTTTYEDHHHSNGGEGLDFAVFGSLYDGRSDPGFGGGAKLNVPVHEHVGIELRALWVDEVSGNPDTPEGTKLDIVPLDLGLSFPLFPETFQRGNIQPFISGGASWVFYYPDGTYDDDDEVGWYAGGGVKVGVDEGLAALVEVLYRGVDVDLEDGRNEVESDLDGVTLNVGLNWSFN